MNNFKLTFLALIIVSTQSFAQKPSKKDYLVTIETEKGIIHAVLFDEAPKHKANFIKL